MRELKLNEAIWFRYKELDMDYYTEDGRVVFVVDEEQEGYSDSVLELLQAKQDFIDIQISFNKWLQAEKWAKDKIYSAKK